MAAGGAREADVTGHAQCLTVRRLHFAFFGDTDAGHDGDMAASTDLLSTGQAARLLGCSRQHVVDLYDQGVLAYVSTGSHRRIRQADATALAAGGLTRDQERSLWLHRVVAGRLAVDPDTVLTLARNNLDHLDRVHPTGATAGWLAQWHQILDAGVDAVFDVLTSRSSRAVELRQNSPFAGALDAEERQTALAAFRAHWRTEHAA